MRDTRRGKIGLLVGVMLLVGAIIVPGTVAQSDPVRTDVGVLRLHLENGTQNRYFRFDTPSASPGVKQLINGSCPVTSLSGPQWVALTGGTTSFTLNRVGLSNNGLGVRFLNCGRVDAPNWSLRLVLGNAPPLDGPGIIGVEYAELDLQGWGNVTAVADLFLDGVPKGSETWFISGNGTRSRMVIDRTGEGEELFDEIRLHPQASFDSVALMGGTAGTNDNDTFFNVVSEPTAPIVSIQKSAVTPTISVGDAAEFNITVKNDGTTASNVVVTDTLPTETGTGLDWEVGLGSDCIDATIDGGVLTCPLGDIGGGETKHVLITSPTTTGTPSPVSNTASVSWDDFDGVVTSNLAEITIDPAGLSITKIADDDQVLAGESVGYMITVTNGLAGTASNVVVEDAPTGTGLIWTYDPDNSDCTNAEPIVDGELECHLGNIPGGESKQVHITALTTDPIGAITNEATVTAANVDPDPDSHSATASIFVGAHTLECGEPDSDDVGNVTLTLQDDGSCAPIVYTITFEDNELLVQKLDDDVVIKVEINAWDPEPVESPVPATIVDPPVGGENVVWCLGTEALPEMPDLHFWCLIKQSTVTYGPDGTDPDWVPDYEGQLMQVTETLLFVGDPGAKRR